MRSPKMKTEKARFTINRMSRLSLRWLGKGSKSLKIVYKTLFTGRLTAKHSNAFCFVAIPVYGREKNGIS